jgi:hypothetical protein
MESAAPKPRSLASAVRFFTAVARSTEPDSRHADFKLRAGGSIARKGDATKSHSAASYQISRMRPKSGTGMRPTLKGAGK